MAEVLVFPLSRRVDHVARLARSMASMNATAADQYLLRQLEQQQDVLQQQSVDQDRIDIALIALARAVRARLWREVILRLGEEA